MKKTLLILFLALATTSYAQEKFNGENYSDEVIGLNEEIRKVRIDAPKSCVKTSTRASDGATGNISYTGAGFTPKKVTIYAAFDAQASYSIGITDGITGSVPMYKYGANYQAYNNNNVIVYIYGSGGAYGQTATLYSFDADGMTLAWTKAGNTGGTIYLTFVYER